MFKLMKVGTDVEFLYYDQKRREIVAADLFCRGQGAFTSRIGTDGHSLTAELRTVPSRNVLMILLDLAISINQVANTLKDINSRGGRDLVAVAQPWFKGEPLGGHIHLSFWSNDSDSDRRNREVFDHLDTFMGWFVQNYNNKFGGKRYGKDFAYRAQPLDVSGRQAPNSRCRFPGRIEYRRPPSWLANPYFAYSFLGLAKLATLRESPSPDLKDFGSPEPDLKGLAMAIDKSLAFLEKAESPILIDFAAWREVLES